MWRNIICHFWLLRAIITNNDKQYDNRSFYFCYELKIENHYSSPYYLQANVQVELANRSFLQIIKTKLDDQKSLWEEELPRVVWAYCTTVRTLTGETPFAVTYGMEAVIPIAIGVLAP